MYIVQAQAWLTSGLEELLKEDTINYIMFLICDVLKLCRTSKMIFIIYAVLVVLDIFLMNWRDWYDKLYIFGKSMSCSLTCCNFFYSGDILMFQKENEVLDEYILIM